MRGRTGREGEGEGRVRGGGQGERGGRDRGGGREGDRQAVVVLVLVVF